MRYVLVFIALVCYLNLTAHGQILGDWVGKIEMTIGDDESLGEEYLLSGPMDVVTDNAGRIYVADYPRYDIRVYTKDGTFLTYIGAKGEGPGEFREIRSLGIDRDGRLVVPDRMSKRITVFTAVGELVDTYPLPISALSLLNYIAQLPDRSTLYLYTYPDREKNDVIYPIRRFSLNYEEETDRYGSASDYYDIDDRIEKRLAGSSGGTQYSASYDTDSEQLDVYLGPLYYSGSFARYRFDSDRLVESQRFHGSIHGLQPFKEIPYDQSFLDNPPKYVHGMSGPWGAVVIDPFVIVRGIYEVRGGRVLVFLRIRKNEDHSLWVDEFEESGEYLGRHSVTLGKPESVENVSRFNVLWKDPTDRFYVTYTSEYGAPLLSVVTFGPREE